MERRPERGLRRDDPWARERAQRGRLFGGAERSPGERGSYPGREWERERTAGAWRGDEASWERSPREPEPPRPGLGSTWRGPLDEGLRSRAAAPFDYDDPWRSECHEARDGFPPGRDSDDDAFGDGPGDDRMRAARAPREQPRTSAERWGFGRAGARDAWGADLRGAIEARAGRFAGRGPRGYQRSDERIREDVCDLLLDAPHVDASGFDVRVSEGEVTLEGTVPDRHMKRDAEDLVESVPGVLQVHDHLRVQNARDAAAVGANGHAGQSRSA